MRVQITLLAIWQRIEHCERQEIGRLDPHATLFDRVHYGSTTITFCCNPSISLIFYFFS